MAQSFLESGDLAEPLFLTGLLQARLDVVLHFFESGLLGGVQAQERATGASVFVDAWCAVGAEAVAELHTPEKEVLLEFGPFSG
ncbi:hypothetical protein OH799_04105 [Nocardia sp. NBC_00881]|uniref:hypothetical protein n=1 Tax=Nocardia sp. NBC_00881 TaxID=2975995 RepID=UPI0038659704|nr:hypothetical protein OH799_04105 [Nocardia sp. NBC_00881]